MSRIFLLLFLWGLMASCSSPEGGISIYMDQHSDQTSFAIQNSELLYGVHLSESHNSAKASIIVESSSASLKPGAFEIIPSGEKSRAIHILSGDSQGAMYGLMDVAEQISFGKALDQLEAKSLAPSQEHRIIKFNLPWSSYRKGEALSLHESTCRDTMYWESFLNMMVQNRFNTLSLWNMHPFTYLIKPEKYPEASPFTEEEMAQWQNFWNSLFRMAKERGIDTYIVNWNIFTSGAFAEAHDLGAYLRAGNFFGDAENSELIEDYTRECVRQVIDEYPDLTGIGLTLGERMGGMSAEERRDWADRTIIEGMRQAGRKVKLLYRAPLSAGKGSHGTTSKSTEELTRAYLDTLSVPLETIISFKYNWSHGHSADKLFIVHGGKLTDTYWNPEPENYSVLWTVRNEDFFMQRWGQPDFVRSFLKNNMASYTSGCIIGSECYIPATDYFSRDMGYKSFTYAFERQWLFYACWGRVLYNNEVGDELFANQLNRKFGISFGSELMSTWKVASDYYHLFNSFVKGTWDATNYAEAFTTLKRVPGKGDESTILTMDLMGKRPVLDTTRFVNITDYVLSGKKEAEGILSPPRLAELLQGNGESILSDLEHYRADKNYSPELELELTDLEILANLQLFFAHRINATLLLADFLVGDDILKREAIDLQLSESIKRWEIITSLKERFNRETIPYMFNEKLNYGDYLEILKTELEQYEHLETFFSHNLK